MRRVILSTILILTALCSSAVILHCEPGQLDAMLAGNNVTELTITGQIDARDFRAIATKLRDLKSLNLYAVKVMPYSSNKALFGNVCDYRADEIPSMSLAGMQHLTTLILPKQATSIGEGAMAACTSLTNVTLPQELSYLGSYALAGCAVLTTVALPAKLKVIGEGAFVGCTALATVTMADSGVSPVANPTSPFSYAACSLTHIGAHAFEGCSQLKSIMLGNTLQSIGQAAFAGTQITQADLSGMRALTSVGDWAYAQTAITLAALPASVTSLGWGAFLLNTHLNSVSLPHSLTTLPALALAGSNLLTEVDLAHLSLDSVGDYALYNLSHVDMLSLPATTQYIGTQAMAGMTGLTQLTSRAASVPALGQDVWQGVDQSGVILKVPASSIDYYRNAEQWREFDVRTSALVGDVNDDGQIDIADINSIINYMLNRLSGVFVFEAADVDQSGIIDIADLNGVINIMLGRILSAPAMMTPNTGDALVIDDFAINTGERRTIDVRLDNSHQYTALQCVINLPDGLELVDGSITVADRASHHSVATRCVGRELRIILYALPNVEFDNNGEAVLRLTVTATDQLPALSDITIDHMAMVTPDGEAYYAPVSRAQVSKTTGVAELAQNNDRVFAANGILYIQVGEPTQAQVVAINGMSRTLQATAGSNTYHNISPGVYVVRVNGNSYKVKI